MPAKLWVPLGTKVYSSVIAQLPSDVDAVFVVLGGSDAVTFMSQYNQTGGQAHMMGGSITVDQSVLSARGPFRKQIIGMLSSGPTADNNDAPEWKSFVAAYRKKFPDGLQSPSLFANNYYTATKAMTLALDQVHGDLSDHQAAFRKTLSNLTVKSPSGEVRLDGNRQGIVDVYLTEVDQNARGAAFQQAGEGDEGRQPDAGTAARGVSCQG